MKGISNRTIRWIFTGFFVLSAVVFFPSVGSSLLALAAVVCAPIAQLDDFFRGRLHIKRGVRIAIAVLLFVAAIPTTPRTDTALPTSDKEPVVAQANIAGGSDADTAGEDELDPAPVSEPAQEPEPDPELQTTATDPAPETTATDPAPQQPEPDPEPAPPVVETTSRTVYVGDTGECYHSEYCRTLKGNKYPISLDDAIASGRRACKVCGG